MPLMHAVAPAHGLEPSPTQKGPGRGGRVGDGAHATAAPKEAPPGCNRVRSFGSCAGLRTRAPPVIQVHLDACRTHTSRGVVLFGAYVIRPSFCRSFFCGGGGVLRGYMASVHGCTFTRCMYLERTCTSIGGLWGGGRAILSQYAARGLRPPLLRALMRRAGDPARFLSTHRSPGLCRGLFQLRPR